MCRWFDSAPWHHFSICPDGGTGRRDGLKIHFHKKSVGSIPSLGTKYLISSDETFIIDEMIVHLQDYGTIAQSVEQQTFNLLVQGSNPCGPTNLGPVAQLDRATAF